ncbi:MAG: M23 family metallopeptidase [Flavobacterium sp.]
MKIVSFLFLIFIPLYGQNFPKNDFGVPLDIPLTLSGTFGELRTNHFHSGVDFRTQFKEGLPVYAIADGYVSRIKISAYGYGKAIYIAHPNGYTSVYAHLQYANSVIETYIKSKQYEAHSFEIDVFPLPSDLPVKQKEVIAYSGNTGSSGGPHLHFEIRDTKTEQPLNPLLFGYDTLIVDTKPPLINAIRVHPLNGSVVNQSEEPVALSLSQQKDGHYVSEKILTNGSIGLSINTHDLSNASWGKNGVYKIKMQCNGKKRFEITFDRFSFDETKHINHYIDYAHYHKTNNRFQKLFNTTAIPLSLVTNQPNDGMIDVSPNMSYNAIIVVEDFHGNATKITIPIQFAQQIVKINKTPPLKYAIKSDVEHHFSKDDISVYIPENGLYENTSVDFEVKKDGFVFGHGGIAIQKYVSIKVKVPENVPDEILQQYFIGMKQGNKMIYQKTNIQNGNWSFFPRSLGEFKIVRDSIAPQIKEYNFKTGEWLSNTKTLEVLITDGLSGIQTYQGKLNGKWILFEYDYKNKKLIHDFNDGIVIEGKNELEVRVMDNVGNSTIFETHFFRSQKK